MYRKQLSEKLLKYVLLIFPILFMFLIQTLMLVFNMIFLAIEQKL